VRTLRTLAIAPETWTPGLQIFLGLQLLDVLTTLLGFRLGLAEGSPFIQFLMRLGPIAGLLGSKLVAIALGVFCIWSGRSKVVRLINYWYAALVVWNLALIVTR
jgi:hypothetical protein